ncbi:MAG: lytic transglycosylase domain-containing protein, partial [Spirochaetaceae bacterium]|nr:lytic transglycosylase domain-containing protein [Spirochaetaceae bacterium]
LSKTRRQDNPLAFALRYRELYPEDFHVRLIMMQALWAVGAYTDLWENARAFTASPLSDLPFPARGEALFLQARAEARLGLLEFAETVRRLFASCPASGIHREAWDTFLEPPQKARGIFSPEEFEFFAAKLRAGEGDYRGAPAAYGKVSLRFANESAFLREYAVILQKAAGWREGLRELGSLLPKVSGDARIVCEEYLGKFHRLGGDYAKSIDFFRSALKGLGARADIFPSTPGTETQRDRLLWYLLSSSLRVSPENMMRLLPEYLPSANDPEYFSDLFELLASALVRARNWKQLEALYSFLRAAGYEKDSSRYAFLLASAVRARLYAPAPGSLPAIREFFEYALAHGEPYYRILAGLALKKDNLVASGSLEFFLPPAPAENTAPSTEEDKFVQGFLDFGLGSRAAQAAKSLQNSLSPETILRVAENEAAEGRYIDALRLLQRASRRPGVVPHRRMLEALYPQAYYEEMEQVLAETGLPAYVFYGLVREESYFDAAIGSHAGAVGLAQLMPATAREVAAQLRIKSPVLTDPLTNLRLGSFYLRSQWNHFGDGLTALAAYNAGTGRARQWRRQNRDLPDVLVAEAFSLAETREYIRKVLVAAVHYGYLYHQKAPRETVREIFRGFS